MTSGQFRSLVQECADLRGEARGAWLDRRIAETPRCSVARYLRGCLRIDRGRTALGVQDLMVAYHTCPDIESAALLVFAGLNSKCRAGGLLAVLEETWEEFRRPEFDRRPRERLLLDAFDEPFDGLGRLAGVARRLWRLPIASLRTELRSAAKRMETAAGPLLPAAST